VPKRGLGLLRQALEQPLHGDGRTAPARALEYLAKPT
jgi:hypothetical protein